MASYGRQIGSYAEVLRDAVDVLYACAVVTQRMIKLPQDFGKIGDRHEWCRIRKSVACRHAL